MSSARENDIMKPEKKGRRPRPERCGAGYREARHAHGLHADPRPRARRPRKKAGNSEKKTCIGGADMI